MAEDAPRGAAHDERAGESAWRASYPYRVEMAICVVLIGVFVFMFVYSGQWEIQTKLFPRLIAVFGALATLSYLIKLIGEATGLIAARETRILDVPWAKVSGETVDIKKTAVGVVLSVALFWIGIVFVGFQVAAPLYLFSQLKIYGKTKTWTAALGAGFMLLVIIVVYDKLAETTWNDPILWDLVDQWFSS